MLGAMPEPESEPTFRVTDRRRRSEETVEPSPAPPPREPAVSAAQPSVEEPPETSAPPMPGPGDRSLVGLFVMLANFAVAALEGLSDPASGQVHADPEQAAELIDLLILLREKTEGRRSADETQTLDELIYELQLRYVQARGAR
jgi:hypothetical protein